MDSKHSNIRLISLYFQEFKLKTCYTVFVPVEVKNILKLSYIEILVLDLEKI